MDDELRAYIEGRRRQVQAAREAVVHQNGEWAADGAMQQLDRTEGWLNLRGQRELLDARVREAAVG